MSDRNFTVINGQLGPWPVGHTFSESTFRARYPAPKEIDGQPVDADVYHADAINRLLGVGPLALPKPAIAVDHDATPKPTPVGPEQKAAVPPPNPLAALELLAATQLKAQQQAAVVVHPVGTTQAKK